MKTDKEWVLKYAKQLADVPDGRYLIISAGRLAPIFYPYDRVAAGLLDQLAENRRLECELHDKLKAHLRHRLGS